MLEPRDTIHLTQGQRHLAIMRLDGRFVGLIDGQHYVTANSAGGAVAALLRFTLGGKDRCAMIKTDGTNLVQAARRVAGDAMEDARPISEEEQEIMREQRLNMKRPTKKDIRSLARDLAGSSRR